MMEITLPTNPKCGMRAIAEGTNEKGGKSIIQFRAKPAKLEYHWLYIIQNSEILENTHTHTAFVSNAIACAASVDFHLG